MKSIFSGYFFKVTVIATSIIYGIVLTERRPAIAASIIEIDGSSTVYPITEAVAEDFRMVDPSARVTVGISGSGGGDSKNSVAARPIFRMFPGLSRTRKLVCAGKIRIRFFGTGLL